MAMPPQLERGLLAKRYSRLTEQRPLVEQLPRIDIDDLCRWKVFPNDWHKAHYLEVPFKYPFLKNLVISLEAIEVNHHNGHTQVIPVHWIRTGFGGNNCPRPMLTCTNCGRAVRRLYCKHGGLSCRRCTEAVYASQICSGRQTRAHLQAHRIQAFIKHMPLLWHRTRKRLQARAHALAIKPMRTSKRVTDKAMLPQLNYQTGARACTR